MNIMIENNLIDEFLNYLKFERHFSPHTAKCYAADLAQFCAFLVGDLAAAGGHQNFTERTVKPAAHLAAEGGPDRASGVAVAVAESTVQQKLRDTQTEQVKA